MSKSTPKYTSAKVGAPLDYPQWICLDCGVKYGKHKTTGYIATWHMERCGICNQLKPCTEPRDFGHLKEGWNK
jgi:hypothetical protein